MVGYRKHAYGGAGNDAMTGLAGDDLLFGGRGNDVHRCGAGKDKATGGPGTDSRSQCESVRGIP